MWTCSNSQCRLQKPVTEFEMAIAMHGKTVDGKSRQCDECVQKRQAVEKEMGRKSAEQVQKMPRADVAEMGKKKVVERVPGKAQTNKKSVEPVNKKSRHK